MAHSYGYQSFNHAELYTQPYPDVHHTLSDLESEDLLGQNTHHGNLETVHPFQLLISSGTTHEQGSLYVDMVAEENVNSIDLCVEFHSALRSANTDRFASESDLLSTTCAGHYVPPLDSMPPPNSAYDDANQAPWVPENTLPDPVATNSRKTSFQRRLNNDPHTSSSVPMTIGKPDHRHLTPIPNRQQHVEDYLDGDYDPLTTDTATSPAFSFDVRRSPPYLSQPRGAFDTSQTSSVGPSELEFPNYHTRLDDIGDEASAGAGVDMIWMEDSDNDVPQYHLPKMPPLSYNFISPPDDLHLTQQDTIAGLGDHFFRAPHKCSGTRCWCLNERSSHVTGQTFSYAGISKNFNLPDDNILDPNKAVVIADRASSTKFEGTIAGSFPPTGKHYPRSSKSKWRQRTVSAPQRTSNVAQQRRSTNRKRRDSAASTVKSVDTLAAIGEELVSDSLSGEVITLEEGSYAHEEATASQMMRRTSSGKARGKRSGQLQEEARNNAARIRREKTMCTNCRSDKQTVSVDLNVQLIL